MSVAKVVDITSGEAWGDGLAAADTQPSPLTKRVDTPYRPGQPDQRVRYLRDVWANLHIEDFLARSRADELPKGSQRHHDATGRIVRRRERMLELVKEAVAVPVFDRSTRIQLQWFADAIETSGSLHDDADLLLIEARIAETEPKPAPPSLAPPRKRTRKAKAPGALRSPAGGS